MREVLQLVLGAVVAFAVQPSFAQTPSTAPAGTQNPALAQPRLVAPPAVLTLPPPPAQAAAPARPEAGSPASQIIPGGAGGLCECLISHDPHLSPLEKNRMHQSCTGSADACQAACNTQTFFSWTPHANFSCPVGPGGNHVALNTRPSVLRLSAK